MDFSLIRMASSLTLSSWIKACTPPWRIDYRPLPAEVQGDYTC